KCIQLTASETTPGLIATKASIPRCQFVAARCDEQDIAWRPRVLQYPHELQPARNTSSPLTDRRVPTASWRHHHQRRQRLTDTRDLGSDIQSGGCGPGDRSDQL